MCQAEACFSPEVQFKLRTLKRELASVRMPAAKMEKAGKKSNRSAVGIDLKNRDILIGDPSEDHSTRELMNNFYAIFSSLQVEDVLAPHESLYSNTN